MYGMFARKIVHLRRENFTFNFFLVKTSTLHVIIMAMNWQQLISSQRLGKEGEAPLPDEQRTEFQRDFDRLIFSSAFRRMQNKTQVFPLPGSVFVHNRLTHSLEVSSVGRSLGCDVARGLRERAEAEPVLPDSLPDAQSFGSIVSAACLAHDMGNPPFGHSGEEAIRSFFREGKGREIQTMVPWQLWSDLINFDGNANTFRLLTHQFIGRRRGGFGLTYSTLASIVKYPYPSFYVTKPKFGFFHTEEEQYAHIARELGIPLLSMGNGHEQWARYPLVYLVEAADDICYEVMDIEDAYKLRLLSFEEASDLLLSFYDEEKREFLKKSHPDVTDEGERIVYYRSCAINALERACVKAFLDNVDAILEGSFCGALIDHINEEMRTGYERCAGISRERIYKCKDVTDIDLAGYQIIYTLLELMTDAVLHPEKSYSQLLLQQVSSQYEIMADDLGTRLRAVIDYISGMTDVYALDLYRKINGQQLPSV